MEKSKYGQLMLKDVVIKSPQAEITSPVVSLKDRRTSHGKEISLTWSCISAPLLLEKKMQKSSSDRFLVFVGSDPYRKETFQAEVELYVGEKEAKYLIGEPKVVYIPAGTDHFPLSFKNIRQPLIYVDISLPADEHSNQPYMASPTVNTHVEETKTFIDGKLIREQKRSFQDWLFIAKEAGGGSLAMFWYVIKEPQTMYEPPHAHDHDQFTIHLGGDPLNFADFHAAIDMKLGEEAEEHTLDSAAILHLPAGVVHRGVNFRQVDRPFMVINVFMSAQYQKARTLSD
jgi:hypothetical protein